MISTLLDSSASEDSNQHKACLGLSTLLYLARSLSAYLRKCCTSPLFLEILNSALLVKLHRTICHTVPQPRSLLPLPSSRIIRLPVPVPDLIMAHHVSHLHNVFYPSLSLSRSNRQPQSFYTAWFGSNHADEGVQGRPAPALHIAKSSL